MLIHVTHDARWARTLSRWYRLETPRRIDTSQVSPEVGLASYCPIIGLDGIGGSIASGTHCDGAKA